MFVVPFRDEAEHKKQLPAVVEHLRDGGLILYPTETVYGLGCMVDEAPLARLGDLKARGGERPFLLLVGDSDQADGLGWTGPARALADAFWPGPLTLILRATDMERYPPRVRSATGGVAVRETPHPGVRRLLEALAAPITSTSANAPGQPPARTPEEALALLRELPQEADVWLLHGEAGGAAPSSIVDCMAEPPRLVRAGAVPIEEIRKVVANVGA